MSTTKTAWINKDMILQVIAQLNTTSFDAIAQYIGVDTSDAANKLKQVLAEVK